MTRLAFRSRPRSRLLLMALAVAALLSLAGCGSRSSSSSSSKSSSGGASATSSSAAGATPATAAGTLGFEGVPIEAGTAIAAAASTGTSAVDGITCGATEQLAYHIHAHLAVFVDGAPRALPGGIGIPGSVVQASQQGPVASGGQCIYWLHTHAPDGIIHVESPTARVYTLGNFFDEWHQPLSTQQVGTAKGPVTATLNGKPWRADVRSLPLLPHAVIQLDVGAPRVASHPVSWAGTGL